MARAFSGTNQSCNNNNGVSNIDTTLMTLAILVKVTVQPAFAAANPAFMTGSAISGGNSAAEVSAGDPSTAGFRFLFGYRWSSAIGGWEHTVDLNLDQVYSLIATYDRGSTANDPVMYIDGQPVSVTENVTPSGTAKSGVDSVTFGENVGGGGDLGAEVAEAGYWSRIVTAGEIKGLGNHLSPKFYRRGLEAHWDFKRDLNEWVQGANLTNSGSTVAVHPRVIYPEAPHTIFVPAAVAGADIRRHIIPAYMRLSV